MKSSNSFTNYFKTYCIFTPSGNRFLPEYRQAVKRTLCSGF